MGTVQLEKATSMTLNLCITLLKFACIGTALFALSWIAGLMGFGPAALFLDFFADLAHLPVEGHQSIDTDTEQLLVAITAGLMIGLAGFVWQITTLVYPTDPQLAARLIVPGALAWFVVDGTGSLLAGAGFNIPMNLVFLLLFLAPIGLHLRTSPRAGTA